MIGLITDEQEEKPKPIMHIGLVGGLGLSAAHYFYLQSMLKKENIEIVNIAEPIERGINIESLSQFSKPIPIEALQLTTLDNVPMDGRERRRNNRKKKKRK